MTRNIKAELLEDCIYVDLQYQLSVRAQIQRGIDHADAGHLVPRHEVKQLFSERWAAR